MEKIKFVCKQMYYEHYDAENVATEGALKQMSFAHIKVTKGFVFVVFVERKDTILNNHLQLHLGKHFANTPSLAANHERHERHSCTVAL